LFRLRGVGPSLVSYYGYANSFIDGSCRRPNSVARFRKREVNNNGEFSYFSSLFPQHHIMTDSAPLVGPRRRRLLPRMAISARSSAAGPERPELSVASVPPSPVASAAASAATLERHLCLRCAAHAARDPLAVCLFDKPKLEKCVRCREQKSSCDPVGILPIISVFLTNSVQIPPALALRGHDILRSRRLLREADSETRRGLLASIRLAAVSFRGQVKARKRARTPLREAGLGSVAGLPVAVAAPASARPTRSAAAVSRVKTRKIVEAPWPPASETAASAPASPSPVSRRSSGLFVSSPVALYEGDATMSGGLPALLSPAALAVVWPPSPSSVPAPSSAATPTTALLDQLLQKAQRLGVVAGDISDSLRALVGFSFYFVVFCVI
jgi:hypothetical protein